MSPDIEWHILDETGQQTVARTTPKLPSRRQKVALAAVGILGTSLGVLYSRIPEQSLPPTPTSIPAVVIPTPTFVAALLLAADPTVANGGQPHPNAVQLVGKIEEEQPIRITVVVTTSGSVELVGKIEERTIRFQAPSGLAVDRWGNLYVLDGGNQRILKYDHDGRFVLKWGSYGTGDGQFDISASENYKSGAIAVDGQGNLYIADMGNSRIQKFDDTGKFLLKWDLPGDAAGQSRKPIGVAVDSQGSVYVVKDRPESRIQKFDPQGKFLREWDSWGPMSSFYAASAIAIDDQDFIYVTDLDSGTLQVFNRDGQIIAYWRPSCGDDRYIAPLGIALDSQGNLYLTDSVSDRICEFSHSGRFLAQWDSQEADDKQFSRPFGIAVDAQGNVYVADSNNDRVLKFRQP